MDFPSKLKYTKDHEWIDTSGNVATIGVTAFAVDQLGDIVHIELPSVGASFKSGASFGTIESTKTVSDLYMPVSGKVIEINQAALSSPESLQSDPYEGGWLVKVECSEAADPSTLLDAKAYEAFISEQ